MVQTFVMNLNGSIEGRGRIHDLLIVDGRHPGAYAVVKMDDFSSDPGIFIVLTPFKAHSFKEFSVKLKAAVGREAPSV